MSLLKVQNLQKILLQEFSPFHKAHPTPNFRDVKNSQFLKDILITFKELGGNTDKIPLMIPKWSLSMNGFAIELDSVVNFNQYRIQTLRSELYDNYKNINVQKYRILCRKLEKECHKSAINQQMWTSKYAEQFFGKAERNGILTGNGSPQWKLRAFQDLIKDLSPIIQSDFKVIRINPFDEIMINKQLIKINDILQLPTQQNTEAFLKYFNRKLNA